MNGKFILRKRNSGGIELEGNKSKKPWPYWVGGIILGIINVIILFVTGKAWKITTSFLYLGAGILELLRVNTKDWYYFKVYNNQLSPGNTYFNNSLIVIIIAMIIGSLLSVLFLSEFKFKKIKNKRQFIAAIVGGILMGYGTRLSFGCNIGAYFSAIPSFSLHGWIFGIFMFVGAWIGSKILFKYLL